MFRVLTCLTVEHDWRLVVVAGLLCFIASLCAISLFHRACASRGRVRAAWVLVAGMAAGFGIWATHFIAMLAYDPGIGIAYEIGLTILSLLSAVVITTTGLGIAVYSPAQWRAPVGGAIVGTGIAAMHYLGMWAVELPGRVTWSMDLVVASIVLGLIYPVHVMIRKSFGLMTRKLSVTESQRSAQFRGTFSRRKLSVASANWAQVA